MSRALADTRMSQLDIAGGRIEDPETSGRSSGVQGRTGRDEMRSGHSPEGRDADPSSSDARTMEAIRAGDPDALQTLMDRHWRGLVRYAARMLGSTDAGEDVAQEVFVRVWEHRSRWTSSGSVQGYLYRIARNLVLQRSRHQEVRERTEPEVRRRAGEVTTPVENAVHDELRCAFEEALEELPERRREAFLLVRMRGLSLREAGEAMGVTRRTVANHVYLAAGDLEAALRPFLS